MRHAAIIVLALAGATLGSSCKEVEPTVEFETIEQDCDNKCEIAIYECGDSPTVKEREGCVDECLYYMEESLDQGHACAQSFETMMACVGTLETCDELVDWAFRDEAGACVEASLVFDKQCEDFR